MELVMRIVYKKRFWWGGGAGGGRSSEWKGVKWGKHLINSRDSILGIPWASGRLACPKIGKVDVYKWPTPNCIDNHPSPQITKILLVGQFIISALFPMRETLPVTRYVEGMLWSPSYALATISCSVVMKKIRWTCLEGAWTNPCQSHSWLRRW